MRWWCRFSHLTKLNVLMSDVLADSRWPDILINYFSFRYGERSNILLFLQTIFVLFQINHFHPEHFFVDIFSIIFQLQKILRYIYINNPFILIDFSSRYFELFQIQYMISCYLTIFLPATVQSFFTKLFLGQSLLSFFRN